MLGSGERNARREDEDIDEDGRRMCGCGRPSDPCGEDGEGGRETRPGDGVDVWDAGRTGRGATVATGSREVDCCMLLVVRGADEEGTTVSGLGSVLLLLISGMVGEFVCLRLKERGRKRREERRGDEKMTLRNLSQRVRNASYLFVRGGRKHRPRVLNWNASNQSYLL